MKINKYLFQDNKWDNEPDGSFNSEQTLVMIFGDGEMEQIKKEIKKISLLYPDSIVMGCSSTGVIHKDESYDHAISVTVTKFEKSRVKLVSSTIDNDSSKEVGEKIAKDLSHDQLRAMFVLCDAVDVDGCQLAQGLSIGIPAECVISGGLVGDSRDFTKTWIIKNKQMISCGICVVGIYGEDLIVKDSHRSGWKRFGIDKKVTKAENNILYTLDNKPALDTYKAYLGKFASQLPASALHFPLLIAEDGSEEPMARAIRTINEDDGSIVFAGSIPCESYVTIGRAGYDGLMDAAQTAAEDIAKEFNTQDRFLCIVTSCIARKTVLKQQIDDELEIISSVLREKFFISGFFSYGELSKSTGICNFYNQTVSLFAVGER